jgi:hypothetical protein
MNKWVQFWPHGRACGRIVKERGSVCQERETNQEAPHGADIEKHMEDQGTQANGWVVWA